MLFVVKLRVCIIFSLSLSSVFPDLENNFFFKITLTHSSEKKGANSS